MPLDVAVANAVTHAVADANTDANGGSGSGSGSDADVAAVAVGVGDNEAKESEHKQKGLDSCGSEVIRHPCVLDVASQLNAPGLFSTSLTGDETVKSKGNSIRARNCRQGTIQNLRSRSHSTLGDSFVH